MQAGRNRYGHSIDFVERLKSRAFQISTALTIVIVLAAVILPQLLNNGSEGWEVGVVDVSATEMQVAMIALQSSEDPIDVATEQFQTRDAAIRALEAEVRDQLEPKT